MRILLVDDHDQVREATRRVLERDGHEVTAVASVNDALQLLDETDVLVTDWTLAGNGAGLVEDARGLGIATVVCAGAAPPDCSADEVVAKGDTARLLAAVRRVGGA